MRSGLGFQPVIKGVERSSGGGHFHKGNGAVLRLQVDAATAVGDHVDGVAQIQRIKHGKLNAVIRREAENIQLRHAVRAQPAIQFGFLPVTVVEKRAVAVDYRILPFMKHGVNSLLFE